MKILQLCKKFPYPLKDGEVIAINTLSKSLKELNSEITLLSMNTSKHPVDIVHLPASFSDIFGEVHDVEVYNHITIWGAFKNFFEKESYHVTRFISKDFTEKLIDILQSNTFDVVQLETVFLTPYIPIIRQYSNAIIALRAHNVEHEIWKRVAEVTSLLPKRWYLNYLNKKLRRFELENIQKCDLLLPITERDLRIFRLLGYKGAAEVTPVGLDSHDYRVNDRSFYRPLSLSFIGALDWMPNQEGLKWFLENVWSKEIIGFGAGMNKNLKFHIAGRNAPSWLKDMKMTNVIFHGEIPSAKQFINEHSMSVVPLFSGSGIRVKILEAMMLGRVVLTTSMGLEGINAQDGEHVLVANTPYDFAEKIRFCLQNPERLREISEKARAFAITHFDNLDIAGRVLSAYEKQLKKPRVVS